MIIFYKDKLDSSSTVEFIKGLTNDTGKDSYIRAKKINDYLTALQIYQKHLGEPYIVHLDSELWELRPLKDRTIFGSWIEGGCVVLHSFNKTTKKTPSVEIEKARQNLKEFNKISIMTNQQTWDNLRQECYIKQELATSDLRVAFIAELAKARHILGYSQKKLEELSGVSQPVIARIEKGGINPQLDTVLRMLAPLGKTLYVGDIEKNEANEK